MSYWPALETGTLTLGTDAAGGHVHWRRYGAIMTVAVYVNGSYGTDRSYDIAHGLPEALRPRVTATSRGVLEPAGTATLTVSPAGEVAMFRRTTGGGNLIQGTLVYALTTAEPFDSAAELVAPVEVTMGLTLASGMSNDVRLAAMGPLVVVQIGVKSSGAMGDNFPLASGIPAGLRPVEAAYGFALVESPFSNAVPFVSPSGLVRGHRVGSTAPRYMRGTVVYVASGEG